MIARFLPAAAAFLLLLISLFIFARLLATFIPTLILHPIHGAR